MEEKDVINSGYYLFFFSRDTRINKNHGINQEGIVNSKGIAISKRGKNNVLCLSKEDLRGCETRVIPLKEHSIYPLLFPWLNIRKG
jgi:hypothetical protein